MLYSASWYESFATTNGETEMLFLLKHLKRLLIGVFLLFLFILIDYRTLNNISQIELASKFDLDIRTIQRWEKNITLLKADKSKSACGELAFRTKEWSYLSTISGFTIDFKSAKSINIPSFVCPFSFFTSPFTVTHNLYE